MSTAQSTNVYTHRIGDDKAIRVPLWTSAGVAVLLDGKVEADGITLSCRAYPGSSTETFDETATGVTVAGYGASGAAEGGVDITLTEAALTSITPGTYVFNISYTVGGTTTTYPSRGSFILHLLPQIR